MHPPAFRLNHHLSDWPDCCLELHCCRGATVYPVRLLMVIVVAALIGSVLVLLLR